MTISIFTPSDSQTVIELITKVFSASEGEEEGQVIGRLVSNLIATTKPQDLIGFIANIEDRIVGSIFFSRFHVPSEQVAFMLSPVAIATNAQGQGIGQQLINHGLNHLKSLDVEMAFTYGNPEYYSKVGFEQINQDLVQAPYQLSQPIGWLAQSLNGGVIKAMQGATRCVEAFSDQKYW